MKKERVAVFMRSYNLANNLSIINFLSVVSTVYSVDFYLQDVSYINTPLLKGRDINFLQIHNYSPYQFTKRYVKNILYKILNRRVTEELQLANLFKSRILRARERLYKSFICIDVTGFSLMNSLFPKEKCLFYSLELLKENELASDEAFFIPFIAETKSLKDNIEGLIIQSKERALYFKEEFSLNENLPTLILPITGKGPSIPTKLNYLRQKYHIPDSCKIALHFGSIAEWYGCYEMVKTFKNIEGWYLVLHGYYHNGTYVDSIKQLILDHQITNVIISEEVFVNIDDADKLLQSSDAGIGWYKNLNTNFYTVGHSSGKLVCYYKFGLPVVTPRFPSFIETVKEPDTGLCIEGFNDLALGLETILNNHRMFSKNSFSAYETVYRIDNYSGKIIAFLN